MFSYHFPPLVNAFGSSFYHIQNAQMSNLAHFSRVHVLCCFFLNRGKLSQPRAANLLPIRTLMSLLLNPWRHTCALPGRYSCSDDFPAFCCLPARPLLALPVTDQKAAWKRARMMIFLASILQLLFQSRQTNVDPTMRFFFWVTALMAVLSKGRKFPHQSRCSVPTAADRSRSR